MTAAPATARAGRFPPLARALASQFIAGVFAFAGAFVVESISSIRLPLLAVVLMQGLLAAALGLPIGLRRWWIPIQVVFPPTGVLLLALALPGWVYLTAFVGLVLVYWNAARGRVPLYLSNRETTAALARLLPDKPGVRFLDLGSGIGGPIAALAIVRRDGTFIGLESAPAPFALSWLRLAFLGPPNAHARIADFWHQHLGGYDVVYAFLSPAPMARLYEKARAEMDKGALLVSNSFEVPGQTPDRVIDVDDGRRTRLLIWRM